MKLLASVVPLCSERALCTFFLVSQLWCIATAQQDISIIYTRFLTLIIKHTKKQRMIDKLRRSCAKLSTADASLSSIPFEQFQPLLSIFYCNLARRLSSSYLHTSLDLATYLLWMLSQSAVDGAGSLAERSFEFAGMEGKGGMKRIA